MVIIEIRFAIIFIFLARGLTLSVLVCGGAGYIGSHVVLELIKKNYEVIVIDNFSTGHKFLVNKKSKFYEGSIKNCNLINKIISENKIDAVINLAGFSQVGESFLNPEKYYKNNVVGLIKLLEIMIKKKVKNIIFSSSAAVYGNNCDRYISESSLTNPNSVYGKTKLICENIISDYAKAYNINFVILRYFNVSGANYKYNIGEFHLPETHIIPKIFQSIIKKEKIKIFGDDYKTKDGTCVRDYIHVSDVANAHVIVLKNITKNTNINKIYNLGNSKGYSVLDILKKCEKIICEKIDFEFVDRRKGDPDILISNCEKIKKELDFETRFSNLENIINTAWKWHKLLLAELGRNT